jgi:hypothetical protein
MNRVRHVLFASFLVAAATFPAAALAEELPAPPVVDAAPAPVEPEPSPSSEPAHVPDAALPAASADATVVAAPVGSSGKPWRGSRLGYGHATTPRSADRGADPFWNPYYTHRLELSPQWNFGQWVFLRGRVELGQELTVADDTEYVREVVLSDVTVDAGSAGWMEPYSGIRISGDVRLNAPTSKVSRAQSRVLSVGPRLGVSRTFPLRSGLTVAYEGRYTQRFHKYTTSQLDGPRLLACVGVESTECLETAHTGRRNVREDVAHGPTLMFAPLERLSIVAAFRFSHPTLYPLAQPAAGREAELRENPYANASPRDATIFSLGVSYPVLQGLELSLGATSFTPYYDPSTSGSRNPFFNRNTTLNLGLDLDFERLLSRS